LRKQSLPEQDAPPCSLLIRRFKGAGEWSTNCNVIPAEGELRSKFVYSTDFWKIKMMAFK